jgi:hypothetical protein
VEERRSAIEPEDLPQVFLSICAQVTFDVLGATTNQIKAAGNLGRIVLYSTLYRNAVRGL